MLTEVLPLYNHSEFNLCCTVFLFQILCMLEAIFSLCKNKIGISVDPYFFFFFYSAVKNRSTDLLKSKL